MRAEDLYEQARMVALEQDDDDPADWPPWEDLAPERRQQMENVRGLFRDFARRELSRPAASQEREGTE